MLQNEGEIVEGQSDPEEQVRRELAEHPEILEAVEERKKRRFAPGGLVLLLVGVILIASDLAIHVSNYALKGLIGGVGVIVLIIGICRILIGLIKPIAPSQL